ncbi:protein kinase [Desulfococcaceae bacterium HSG8]|nr:protein kinase [Desulfococcaceae bacterium HSG8]
MHVEVKVTAGPAEGQTFTFYEPDCFLFGRAADARVSLSDDPYVSRHHFLMEISPPECMVTDLNSKNGMFVNRIRYGGRKPPEPGVTQGPDGIKEVRLKNGDQIAVGDTIMEISIKMGTVVCAECGEEIPAGRNADSVICPSCSRKQQIPSKQGIRRCAYCGKNVTDEADIGTRADSDEYVCEACRRREIDDPVDIFKSLIADPDATDHSSDVPAFKGYRLDDELGRGGMSVVYKAVEESTGRVVAIKTMLPQVAADETSVRMFQREVKITKQLRHKNIVEILRHGKTGDTIFFVMEFVDGTDLDQFIKSKGGRLDIKEAAPIMLGVLEGLAHAHRVKLKLRFTDGREKRIAGIVHRDLKPRNILLAGASRTPKIVDFGLSKSFETAGLSNMTMAGQVAGTPVYWPREQITHYKYLSPVTDVFSIAVVFYEALTGAWVRKGFREMFFQCQREKKSPGVADYMRVISENPAVPIREHREDIPEPVARVIDRALREAEVPADETKMRSVLSRLRYPDAGVFRDKLIKALVKSGVM